MCFEVVLYCNSLSTGRWYSVIALSNDVADVLVGVAVINVMLRLINEFSQGNIGFLRSLVAAFPGFITFLPFFPSSRSFLGFFLS